MIVHMTKIALAKLSLLHYLQVVFKMSVHMTKIQVG